MLKVGILGFGAMGKMHFDCYVKSGAARVVAVSDVNIDILKEYRESNPEAFEGVKAYGEPERLIAESELDLVDITLPTYLHEKYALLAFAAGRNVLCEKPIALNMEEAGSMLEAYRQADAAFMVGHSTRFWHPYEIVKEYIQTGKYGKALLAYFGRFNPAPLWGWENWLHSGEKSGGAALDLHVHDTDIVNWYFGLPEKVFSSGVKKTSGAFDSISTIYSYPEDLQVSAEGGWIYHPTFETVRMFRVVFEGATVEFDSTKTPAMAIHVEGGETVIPELRARDRYASEIDYFLDCLRNKGEPEVITPGEAVDSLKIALAEIESAEKREPVRV